MKRCINIFFFFYCSRPRDNEERKRTLHTDDVRIRNSPARHALLQTIRTIDATSSEKPPPHKGGKRFPDTLASSWLVALSVSYQLTSIDSALRFCSKVLSVSVRPIHRSLRQCASARFKMMIIILGTWSVASVGWAQCAYMHTSRKEHWQAREAVLHNKQERRRQEINEKSVS